MRTIVKEDLKLSPLKMTSRQQTALQKQKRLERSKILLNAIKDGRQAGEIIFSDGKMFTVEAKFNSQNNRILAKSADSIPTSVKSVFRRQKPASVMVWAFLSESWNTPHIFLKEGAKINANQYIDDILTPAHAQMKKHFKDRPFTFQDIAPSHTANKTQHWSERHFSSFWKKELCSPSSLDLNPLDFCVWSILEREACSTVHDNTEALKKFPWARMGQNLSRNVSCSSKKFQGQTRNDNCS